MRKKKTTIEETLPDAPLTDLDGKQSVELPPNVVSKLYKFNSGTKSFCLQTSEPIDELFIQSQYPTGGKFVVIDMDLNTGDQLATQYFDIEPKPMQSTIPNGNGGNTDNIQIRMLFDELQWMRQTFVAMLNNRNSPATPVQELIAGMQGLHALAPAGKSPVDLLIEGMKLGAKANHPNGGDWKSELIQTAKDVLTPAVEAYTVFQQQQRMDPNMQTEVKTIAPGSTMLKMGLKWLKSKILENLPPDLAVEWVMQNASDQQYQPFLALAVNGTIENFIEIDAEIGNEPYRSWFTTAIQLLKDAYANANTVDTDSERGDRDNSDAPNHAADRPAKSPRSKSM